MRLIKDKYEDKIALRSVAEGAVAIEPEECLFVQKNDGLEIDGIERGPYVPSGAEAALLERLSAAVDAAKSGVGTVVLLLGDVGTAKSATASAALFMLLERRSDVAVLTVDPDYPFDGVKARHFFTTAKGRGYVPVVHFDAFVAPTYSTYAAYQTHYFDTLNNAVKYAELVQRHGAVGLFVFSNDQIGAAARAKEFRLLVRNFLLAHGAVDVDAVVESRGAFAKRLVEAYSGMRGETVDRVAKAAAARRDGYAALAVWAAVKLREGASAEEALEWAERKYLEFAINRIWHWLFGSHSSDPRSHAWLFLVAGLLGLQEAGVAADDYVSHWLASLPQYSMLHEAVRRLAQAAVHRYLGLSDDICREESGGPCYLVKLMEEELYALPRKSYKSVEEVAREYLKRLTNRGRTP